MDSMKTPPVRVKKKPSERTLKRWKKAYELDGEQGLEPKSTAPKTQPHETPIWIKEEVIALRKKTKLCAQKLHWRLIKEKDLKVPVSTIGKILKQERLVRKYRKKKVKYKYLRAERKPGELIEIDVKHVPGHIKKKKYYQYTAIDMATRWRYLKIFDEESSFHSICFLKVVMKKFPYKIQAIKTDNHSTFTNYYLGTNKRSDMTVKTIHALDRFCATKGIIHYLIDLQQRTLLEEEANQMPCFIHSVNDLEKIDDYAEDILNLTERMKKNRHKFQKSTLKELQKIFNEIDKLFDQIIETVYGSKRKAQGK